MNEPVWEPPENPDPSEVLRSAMFDRREGRYDVALAKYVWFFHHALEYKRGMSAVRLSFALSYWND
ncbi:hypothetical protein [Blastopirellula marina]|uniref:Uncharacterized protein n=1 Tax=Blastopirellula marina TaxID=124 RepID=A0A2S8GTS5_9BACT|nr:hypothetical protein [Blastopirellula marina]PQO47828.1 hypothetical protein C5Y93_01950 [Blastopirellula marina]